MNKNVNKWRNMSGNEEDKNMDKNIKRAKNTKADANDILAKICLFIIYIGLPIVVLGFVVATIVFAIMGDTSYVNCFGEGEFLFYMFLFLTPIISLFLSVIIMRIDEEYNPDPKRYKTAEDLAKINNPNGDVKTKTINIIPSIVETNYFGVSRGKALFLAIFPVTNIILGIVTRAKLKNWGMVLLNIALFPFFYLVDLISMVLYKELYWLI